MSEEDEEIMLKAIVAYKAERKKPHRRLEKLVIPKHHVIGDGARPPRSGFRYPAEKRKRIQESLAKSRAYRKEHRLCRECAIPLEPEDLSRCSGCKCKHNVRYNLRGKYK